MTEDDHIDNVEHTPRSFPSLPHLAAHQPACSHAMSPLSPQACLKSRHFLKQARIISSIERGHGALDGSPNWFLRASVSSICKMSTSFHCCDKIF